MTIVIIVFLIFVIIPGALNFYALGKAAEICEQVEREQPGFFDIKRKYKKLTKINKSQFMFYILSGKYKLLSNKNLIKKCRIIRWIYIISFSTFGFFCLIMVLYSIFHP